MAAARKLPRVNRIKTAMDEARRRRNGPVWALLPCLANEDRIVYELAGGVWELERVDTFGVRIAVPDPIPERHVHERERFGTLEAAIEAAGVDDLIPTSILCCMKVAEGEETVRSVRLLPGPGGFYALRIDAGLGGVHYHDERPQGPYPLVEAMRLAWAALADERPPICPCATMDAVTA